MRWFLPLLFLSGCATAGHVQIVTKKVDVPVRVSCIPKDTPKPPTYPDTKDTLIAASAPDGRYRLLASGWGVRNARLDLLEKLVDNCR